MWRQVARNILWFSCESADWPYFVPFALLKTEDKSHLLINSETSKELKSIKKMLHQWIKSDCKLMLFKYWRALSWECPPVQILGDVSLCHDRNPSTLMVVNVSFCMQAPHGSGANRWSGSLYRCGKSVVCFERFTGLFSVGGCCMQQYYGLCSLEIGSVRREDGGLYAVTATNPRGTISCSATLDVQRQ